MRLLTFILDALVIAFITFALYRLATQKGDAEIEKDREKIDRTDDLFKNLDGTFDEESGDSVEEAVPAR